jgi:hypothetical protein
VAELVEAQVRVGPQATVIAESVLLEETADRLAAREEILFGGMQCPSVGGEHRCLIGRRYVHSCELDRTLAERKAGRMVHEIREHEEAVVPECRNLRFAECLRSQSPCRSITTDVGVILLIEGARGQSMT